MIIDGKKVATELRNSLKEKVQKFNSKPKLVIVSVGDDPASKVYVRNKLKACDEIGIAVEHIQISEVVQQETLISLVKELNVDKEVNGIIVQLPLPKHIDEQKVLMAVHPDKDVDGFHPTNVGRMTLDLPSFLPATPFGILELLERYNVETSGQNVLVIGRSHIVGRPMSILMSQKRPAGNATVTVAHSRTKNLKEFTLKADIIVAALGIPEFLTGDMVTEGVTIVDVGITRVDDATKKRGYRLAGDVHFESVSPKSAYITPVPGGVGPMTIAMLMKNTLLACERKS